MILLLRRHKKTCIARLRRNEARVEFRADLVIRLRNAGANGGPDAAATRAEAPHGLDHACDYAALGALPAGMGGADDLRVVIGQKDGRAICGENTQCNAGLIRCHRIGTGAGADLPGRCDGHGARTVDLIERHKRRSRPIGEAFEHAPAILDDVAPFVARSGSAIERAIDASGDAALPPKKAMRDGGSLGQVARGQNQHGSKSGRRRRVWRGDCQRLGQAAHLRGIRQPVNRGCDRRFLRRVEM